MPATSLDSLYIAHRGLPSKLGSESLADFIAAIDAGASGLEFDVRQTRDGTVVVHHDRNITSISSSRNVAIEDIDIPLNEKLAHSLLSLSDLLNGIRWRTKSPLWIEIKESSRYPGIVRNLVAVLRDAKIENIVVIQSFETRDLIDIRKIDPSLSLLKLSLFPTTRDLAELPSEIEYVGIPLVAACIFPSLIGKIHNSGRKVILWRESSICEKREYINKLYFKGADGFMLDVPPYRL